MRNEEHTYDGRTTGRLCFMHVMKSGRRRKKQTGEQDFRGAYNFIYY